MSHLEDYRLLSESSPIVWFNPLASIDCCPASGLFHRATPNGWMVYNGKSQAKMDDSQGYPNFRKPPSKDLPQVWASLVLTSVLPGLPVEFPSSPTKIGVETSRFRLDSQKHELIVKGLETCKQINESRCFYWQLPVRFLMVLAWNTHSSLGCSIHVHSQVLGFPRFVLLRQAEKLHGAAAVKLGALD